MQPDRNGDAMDDASAQKEEVPQTAAPRRAKDGKPDRRRI